jgi:hypothetical protein
MLKEGFDNISTYTFRLMLLNFQPISLPCFFRRFFIPVRKFLVSVAWVGCFLLFRFIFFEFYERGITIPESSEGALSEGETMITCSL